MNLVFVWAMCRANEPERFVLSIADGVGRCRGQIIEFRATCEWSSVHWACGGGVFGSGLAPVIQPTWLVRNPTRRCWRRSAENQELDLDRDEPAVGSTTDCGWTFSASNRREVSDRGPRTW